MTIADIPVVATLFSNENIWDALYTIFHEDVNYEKVELFVAPIPAWGPKCSLTRSTREGIERIRALDLPARVRITTFEKGSPTNFTGPLDVTTVEEREWLASTVEKCERAAEEHRLRRLRVREAYKL